MTPLLRGFRAIGSTAGPSGRGGAGVGLVRGTAQQKRIGTIEQRPEQSEKTLGADTSPIFSNEGMRVAAGLMNFAIFVATEWFVDVC